jgi:hypothetical protein
MKLIIDISEDALKEMKTEEFISIESLDVAIECIKNGTPLDRDSEQDEVQAYYAGMSCGWEEGRKDLIDDVKNEIYNIPSYERDGRWVMADILKVLDNIDKTESEEK